MVPIRALAELMTRNGPPIRGWLWLSRPSCSRGSVPLDVDDRRGTSLLGLLRQTAALTGLAIALSACQVFTSSSDYPDLRSVSSPGDPTSPLEERREIVRDLINDRDLARHRQSVVRHRSGLSDIPPTAAPASTAIRAEDIVREVPAEDQSLEDAAENDPDRAYRDRTQFDDGTLNDFIRRLKKETTPPIVGGVVEELPSEEELEPPGEPETQSWRIIGKPVVLAAFAPSILEQDPPQMAIRLAAEEPGTFCTYLGWMVAWSSACLDDEEGASSSANDAASADIDDNRTDEQPPSASTGGRATDAPADTESETTGADQSPNGTGGDTTLSEDVDADGVSPVTGSFDRLIKLLRSGSRSGDRSSDTPRSLSFEAEALQDPVPEGPQLPVSRPDVAKDLRVVKNDVAFDFTRTPTPAFKPVQPEPRTVIFPRERSGLAERTIFVPTARPPLIVADLEVQDGAAEDGISEDGASEVTELQEDEEALAAKDLDEAKKDLTGGEPSTTIVDLRKAGDPSLLDHELISFEPESATLPIGIEERLEAMLADAKGSGGKLHIVSQASIGSLAMERARGVGLALVRLGATADLIEYDILINRQADQVELLLKADANSEE